MRVYTYFFIDARIYTCYNSIIERRKHENTGITQNA